MVDITRQPREVITPKWSKSIVVNAFRVYEYWFGRRAGIRFEGSTLVNNGKSYRVFGTWENVLVFVEYTVRDLFKGLVPAFEIIRVPDLVLTNGVTVPSPFRFAVAFDAASFAASTTVSCTVSGSNGYMFACGGYSATSGAMSGVFNLVAMTSDATQIWVGGSNPINGMRLASPTTGTNNLVITGGNGGCAIANTYSGCDQGAPDQYVTAANSGGSNTSIATVTTSTANCWMVMMAIAGNNTPSAGTNATGRSINSAGAGANSSFDSNGNITTGSFSMTVNFGGGNQTTGCFAYKFAQVTVATVNSGFFLFM